MINIRRILCITCITCISGCATLDTPATVSTRTVEVRVPVPVPCLDAADIPARPTPTPVDVEHATDDQIAAAAAADLIALDAYATEVSALLPPCTKGANP